MKMPFNATRRQGLGTILVMTGAFVAAVGGSVIRPAMAPGIRGAGKGGGG